MRKFFLESFCRTRFNRRLYDRSAPLADERQTFFNNFAIHLALPRRSRHGNKNHISASDPCFVFFVFSLKRIPSNFKAARFKVIRVIFSNPALTDKSNLWYLFFFHVQINCSSKGNVPMPFCEARHIQPYIHFLLFWSTPLRVFGSARPSLSADEGPEEER